MNDEAKGANRGRMKVSLANRDHQEQFAKKEFFVES